MDSSSRVTVACETCRKRKRKVGSPFRTGLREQVGNSFIQCDGLRPACSFCLVRDRVCEYNTEKRIRRRVDPDYVRTLEDQIAVLKEELAQAQASTRTTSNEYGVQIDRGAECGNAGDNSSAVSIPPGMTTAIDDISALVWRMSIDNNGDASFIGPSGNFCFPVAHWDYSGPQYGKNATTSPGRGGIFSEATIQVLWSDQVGTQSVASHLLDVFARCINPIHQFVGCETLDQLRGDNLGPGLRLIKAAALAAGALFADDAQSKALGGEAAAIVDAAALQHCRQSPDISTIQALSIMSWRELGLEQHNMAWMYNSMCASLVLHLGLSVSITPEIEAAGSGSGTLSGESNTQKTRLRTLWSSVFMDRIATSLLGRNCLLQWKRINAPSFLSAVGASPSVDELAFDHQCRLWFIHDQYMDIMCLLLQLLRAQHQLHAFYRNIHPSLQLSTNTTITTTQTLSILYLHISYHMSYILIHRPYLKDAAQNNPTIYRLAIRSVSTAATSIVRLLRIHTKILPFSQMPPFIVHSVLTAAMTHLCNATSTHQALRSQATAHFRVCFGALVEMQSRWVSAKRAVRLLRGLARRWRIMGALPLRYGFGIGANGEETGQEVLEGVAEREKAVAGQVERESESEKVIDVDEGTWQEPWSWPWPWAADGSVDNVRLDGEESMSTILPDVLDFDPDFQEWDSFTEGVS
ncbi:hypothetical protein BJY01DRAFT_233883 [Aspergillus pseudoustus]|uniref:Zn(2)-C6 fungal-type domain-containing protein n=1 Tax=Aspergillus pseudoustus TaxID=1810923 RepID=A0ABR4K8G3_9EURO